eukprot:gene10763-9436_t
MGLKPHLATLAALGGIAVQLSVAAPAPYESKFFHQKLNHFDPTDMRTWAHRYLTNMDSWD